VGKAGMGVKVSLTRMGRDQLVGVRLGFIFPHLTAREG